MKQLLEPGEAWDKIEQYAKQIGLPKDAQARDQIAKATLARQDGKLGTKRIQSLCERYIPGVQVRVYIEVSMPDVQTA